MLSVGFLLWFVAGLCSLYASRVLSEKGTMFPVRYFLAAGAQVLLSFSAMGVFFVAWLDQEASIWYFIISLAFVYVSYDCVWRFLYYLFSSNDNYYPS